MQQWRITRPGRDIHLPHGAACLGDRNLIGFHDHRSHCILDTYPGGFGHPLRGGRLGEGTFPGDHGARYLGRRRLPLPTRTDFGSLRDSDRGGAPHDVDFSSDGTQVFVSDEEGGRLIILDAASLE